MKAITLNLTGRRILVALIPLLGVFTFPVVVLLFITRGGLNIGIGTALLLSTAWFVLMLITSEMPHPENSSD